MRLGYEDRSANSPSIVSALYYRAGGGSVRVQSLLLLLLCQAWFRTVRMVCRPWPSRLPHGSGCRPEPLAMGPNTARHNQMPHGPCQDPTLLSSALPSRLPSYTSILPSTRCVLDALRMPGRAASAQCGVADDRLHDAQCPWCCISYVLCVMPKQKRDATYPSSFALGPLV